MLMHVPNIPAPVRQQRREAAAAVAGALAAAAAGDGDAFVEWFGRCETLGVVCRAIRGLGRHAPPLTDDMRAFFLELWIRAGDAMRSQAACDLDLVAMLRACLPPYDGPALRLYRGDSFWNRRRRTYGLSWTMNQSVAEGYAAGLWRACVGGSVVLEADVPAQAVIATVPADGDRYGERECLVDRRHLGAVRVIRRLRQAMPESAVT